MASQITTAMATAISAKHAIEAHTRWMSPVCRLLNNEPSGVSRGQTAMTLRQRERDRVDHTEPNQEQDVSSSHATADVVEPAWPALPPCWLTACPRSGKRPRRPGTGLAARTPRTPPA